MPDKGYGSLEHREVTENGTFFDIIEYVDEGKGEMVHRVPERGSGDFRIGSQLIVRESQAAVFFRDGKALDTFGAGRHTITTANIRCWLTLSAKLSPVRPIQGRGILRHHTRADGHEVGNSQPITIVDPILRMARVTGYGTTRSRSQTRSSSLTKIVSAHRICTAPATSGTSSAASF